MSKGAARPLQLVDRSRYRTTSTRTAGYHVCPEEQKAIRDGLRRRFGTVCARKRSTSYGETSLDPLNRCPSESCGWSVRVQPGEPRTACIDGDARRAPRASGGLAPATLFPGRGKGGNEVPREKGSRGPERSPRLTTEEPTPQALDLPYTPRRRQNTPARSGTIAGCTLRLVWVARSWPTSCAQLLEGTATDRANGIYLTSVAVAPHIHTARNGVRLRCLACGSLIEATYSRLGSLRCDDCRLAQMPLDPAQVTAWRRSGAHV